MKRVFSWLTIFIIVFTLFGFLAGTKLSAETITDLNGYTFYIKTTPNFTSAADYFVSSPFMYYNNVSSNLVRRIRVENNQYVSFFDPNNASRTVYSNGSWASDAYRTWTFISSVTNTDFISWVQANGTMVSAPSSSYTVTQGTVSNGSVSFSASTVSSGGNITVTTTPSSGYGQPSTSDFTISGTYGSLTGSNGTYTISNITSNISVGVSFPASVTTYTVSAGTHTNGQGVILQSDLDASSIVSVRVASGGTVTVLVGTPDTGYVRPVTASDFNIGGTYGSLTQDSTYDYKWYLNNVTSNCTVNVTYPTAEPSSTYVDFNVELLDCQFDSNTNLSTVTPGTTWTGTIVPNNGYTYPLVLILQSAGFSVTHTYDNTTGVLTVPNVPSVLNIAGSAVQENAGSSITYNLTHCTCSISITSYNNGTNLSFTLTPDTGYIMSDADTKVVFDGVRTLVNTPVPSNSYSYSYYEPSAEGDLVITGVAKPWYEAVQGGSGYNNYPGSYQDGYDTGFIDGQNSVSSGSGSVTGQAKYDAILNSGMNIGVNLVAPDSPNSLGRLKYQTIYNSGITAGVSSVNSSADIGSPAYNQYLTAYNYGVSSVTASASSSSLAGSRYQSIYNTGYEDGYRVGEQLDASGAIVGFVPTIIASIGGGLLYTGDHISVFGISLASIFGLLVLFSVGLWVFKIFKGAL